MRGRRTRRAFTLIEALVSIAILAALIVMLASVFRQATTVTRRARGGAEVFRTARQVFESLGRDLAGVTHDGFLFIRTHLKQYASGQPRSGLLLYYDEDGEPVRLNNERFDCLVMSASGYHVSAVDAERNSNFARIIWGQTERARGNDLAAAETDEKYWGIYQVLARHQTLMMPDRQPADLSNAAYAAAAGSDSQRGADFYNMGVSDLTRFFGPAMGERGDGFPYVVDSFGLFAQYVHGWLPQELAPYRLSSKVWRLGRDGPGPGGQTPGQAGTGDLTSGQVHVNRTIPEDVYYNSGGGGTSFTTAYSNHDMFRGMERPKIFGPSDYHRIAAVGVAAFQIDWTDGRRWPRTDGGGETIDTHLHFYPAGADSAQGGLGYVGSVSRTGSVSRWEYGAIEAFCWNRQSPKSIRDTSLRKAFGGISGRRKDLYHQNMFGFECMTGGAGIGRGGWPWPRAVRVRLLIFDTGEQPPMGYRFEQVYHLLVQ